MGSHETIVWLNRFMLLLPRRPYRQHRRNYRAHAMVRGTACGSVNEDRGQPMKLTSHKSRLAAPAGLLALTLGLAACGGNGDGNGGAAADGEFDPEEEVTLTVSWWGNDERARMMDEVFALFSERHENITVRAEPTGDPDNLFTRLSTDFAAGGGPDLFTLGGAMPQEYGGAGQLLDLETVSDYVDLDPYEDFTTTNATVDGTLYGLPTGGNAIGLLVNVTLFEEAGVEPPSPGDFTWDEAIAKASEI